MALAPVSKILEKFTWDEVKKHNTVDDCWIVLEREIDGEKKGIVLDVTAWAPKHPGGQMIYDGAGGDCTIMFWSYHPLSFIDNCSSYVYKYGIGEIENYKCVYEVGSKFHRTLKQRVEDKIPASQRRSDWRMWLKSVIILSVALFSFWQGWIKGNLLFVFMLGFSLSQTGLNIMHDGIHMAFSRSVTLCTLASLTFNMCGANFLAYRRAHAFGHHAYTNHLEYDTGITGSFPVLRLHDRLPRTWYQYFQHIYVVPIYLFSIFVFWLGDYEDTTTQYNFPKRHAPVSAWQWFVVYGSKALFFSWYIGVHFWMFEWRKALVDCIIMGICMGACAILFFVVNHWTEKAVLITNQDLIRHTSDWAMLQILASSNFSTKSWFWTHLSGGLNLQIEHHLFPGIIHTRLPDIAPIVQETCYEYGIRYDDQCYDSFWTALFKHLFNLKKLGNGSFEGRFPAIGKRKHA